MRIWTVRTTLIGLVIAMCFDDIASAQSWLIPKDQSAFKQPFDLAISVLEGAYPDLANYDALGYMVVEDPGIDSEMGFSKNDWIDPENKDLGKELTGIGIGGAAMATWLVQNGLDFNDSNLQTGGD